MKKLNLLGIVVIMIFLQGGCASFRHHRHDHKCCCHSECCHSKQSNNCAVKEQK